jgi:hypothetical protein
LLQSIVVHNHQETERSLEVLDAGGVVNLDVIDRVWYLAKVLNVVVYCYSRWLCIVSVIIDAVMMSSLLLDEKNTRHSFLERMTCGSCLLRGSDRDGSGRFGQERTKVASAQVKKSQEWIDKRDTTMVYHR